MTKKYDTILSLIEVAENNLKNAKALLVAAGGEKPIRSSSTGIRTPGLKSKEEEFSLEVVEGYFDGEAMVGDNGQIYPVPQNYASKTQLVIGDRMKWILTEDREVFKLIQPASRIRVTGNFNIEGDNYLVLADQYPSPIKILKASATYAMKNLGLELGDTVAIYIPRDATPTWGAFISVVKGVEAEKEEERKKLAEKQTQVDSKTDELDVLKEFDLEESEDKPASQTDFF